MSTLRVNLAARAAKLWNQSRRSYASATTADRQKLVIVGSGWAGYEVLKQVDRKAYDVTVVSPLTYFAFTPLLASAAVGSIEFRCAVEPVRRYAEQVTSHQAWCNSIDLKAKTLKCVPATAGANPLAGTSAAPEDSVVVKPDEDRFQPDRRPFTLQYDKIVIACGAYSQTFGTPGVKEYGHFLKDVKDARKVRTRLLECFEHAAQPNLSDDERKAVLHFVVVGAGPTGIEFASELDVLLFHDLLATDMQKYYPAIVSLARITIYDVAPTILPGFDATLIEFAMKQFGRQGVKIKTSHHVTSVSQTTLEVKEEGTVPYGMLVWSTGLSPNPLIESISELKHDPKTQSLEVDDQLRTYWADGRINPDVFCIGDASALASGKLPATAEVAWQEAGYIAKVLNAAAKDGSQTGAFELKNPGIRTVPAFINSVGEWRKLLHRGEAKQGGPKPVQAVGHPWLLWRSAYYSSALSLKNKVSLVIYWLLNSTFGRDIERF